MSDENIIYFLFTGIGATIIGFLLNKKFGNSENTNNYYKTENNYHLANDISVSSDSEINPTTLSLKDFHVPKEDNEVKGINYEMLINQFTDQGDIFSGQQQNVPKPIIKDPVVTYDDGVIETLTQKISQVELSFGALAKKEFNFEPFVTKITDFHDNSAVLSAEDKMLYIDNEDEALIATHFDKDKWHAHIHKGQDEVLLHLKKKK